MDNRDVESRYGVYATIRQAVLTAMQNDCVTDAEEWSEKVCERIYGNDARIRWTCHDYYMNLVHLRMLDGWPFHKDVPFEFIDKVTMLSDRHRHIYQILEKSRAADGKVSFRGTRAIPANVWLLRSRFRV